MLPTPASPRKFATGPLRLPTNDDSSLAQILARRLRDMEALYRLSQEFSASLDLDQVLQTVVTTLRDMLATRAACIMLAGEDQSLHIVALAGLPLETHRNLALPPGEGISGHVLMSGHPIYVADVRQDPRYKELDAGLISILVVPLNAKGRVIGTLSVDSERPNAFDVDTERLLVIAAGQAAIAIENARLYQAERSRAEALNTIIDLSRQVTQSLELEQVFCSAHQAIAHLMPAEAFNITLYDQPKHEAILSYIFDKGVRYPAMHLDANQGMLGYVLNTNQPLIIRDVLADPLPFAPVHYGDREHVRSLLAIPLRFGMQTVGILSTQSYQPNAFGEDDLRLLQGIADHVAVAIVNASLYSELLKRFTDLQEVDHLRMELIQNVSHDLRTPLTFLRAYVDLLVTGEFGALNMDQLRALTLLQAKTAGLVRLVEDITNIERRDTQWLQCREMNLHQVAQLAVAAAAVVASKRGVRVELHVPNVLPSLWGDPDRIGQVFDNLLGNAIKFCFSGSKIVVHIFKRDDCALVSVSDQGEGIPQDEQERIFERFYQASTSSRRHHGLGLGLAIVKSIIELHGGQIWVESEVGIGSTFTFTLPFTRPPVPTTPEEIP